MFIGLPLIKVSAWLAAGIQFQREVL